MVVDPMRHIRTMWEPNQALLASLQFARLPPGIHGPTMPRLFGNAGGDLIEDASSKINGFRNAFLQSASSLAGSEDSAPSLPGQAPYIRGDRLESLRSKNHILEKENMELKKQLEELRGKDLKSA